MTIENKSLRNFCDHYDVRILDDQKRHARYHPPVFFSDSSRSDLVQTHFNQFETEKLYTVEIPESKLNTLVEMEGFFHNGRLDYKTRDMFEMLMEKERLERELRFRNEAVRKAYEQYSLMLHLAGFDKKL
jgi:hypothetical protein